MAKQLEEVEAAIITEGNNSSNKHKILELYKSKSQFTESEFSRLLIVDSVNNILDGKYDLALKKLTEAQALTVSEAIIAKIYTYKTTVYLSTRQYSKALDSITVNLNRISNIDEMELKASAYLRVANSYLELEAFHDVLYYAKVAFNTKVISPKDKCYAMLLISAAELKLKNYSRSEAQFENSIDYCSSHSLPLVSAMALKGVGENRLMKGDFSVAIEYFLKSLKVYKSFNYRLEINSVHALLSNAYLALGENEIAKMYALLVIELPSEPSNLEFKRSVTKILSSLSYQEEEYRQAYDYLALYQALSKTLLNDTKAKANAYQMAKFENGEKNREIRLLNKDRELYTAKAELTESQRNNEHMMFLLICGSLVVLTLFAINMTLQKRKYMRLAQFDALTGIFNRGTGQNLAENRYIKDSMSGIDFSVILFDLDHFKSVNDNYGHAMGDWVLKKVCEVVSKECRSSDIFTRFGGEEFVLFMPNTSESVAREVAVKCKSRILAIDTRYSGHEFTISASFGVATSTAIDLSLDPILQRADIAMYQSKEQGRERV
ncbi:diguanylate cyclase [Shewanella woodyi]|uniref:diguanylate cyclase n=1 Tax=Shewanella woodyi TaxID=60961 RepID=UPI003749FCD0